MTDSTYPKTYERQEPDGIPAALVIADGGSIQFEPTSVTSSTFAFSRDLHDGRTVVFNRAAGVTATLPPATGSGARFCVSFGTPLNALTSHVIQVANGGDYFRGAILAVTDSANGSAPDAWATANSGTVATESDTVTLDGTTKGGLVGDWFEFEDIAANVWMVHGGVKASGVEASPFSAAV